MRILYLVLGFCLLLLAGQATGSSISGGATAGSAMGAPARFAFEVVPSATSGTAPLAVSFEIYTYGNPPQDTYYLITCDDTAPHMLATYQPTPGDPLSSIKHVYNVNGYCLYEEAGTFNPYIGLVNWETGNFAYSQPTITAAEPGGAIDTIVTVDPVNAVEPVDYTITMDAIGQEGYPTDCDLWCDCAGDPGTCGTPDATPTPTASPIVDTTACTAVTEGSYTIQANCTRNGQTDNAKVPVIVDPQVLALGSFVADPATGTDPHADVDLTSILATNCPASVNVRYQSDCVKGSGVDDDSGWISARSYTAADLCTYDPETPPETFTAEVCADCQGGLVAQACADAQILVAEPPTFSFDASVGPTPCEAPCNNVDVSFTNLSGTATGNMTDVYVDCTNNGGDEIGPLTFTDLLLDPYSLKDNHPSEPHCDYAGAGTYTLKVRGKRSSVEFIAYPEIVVTAVEPIPALSVSPVTHYAVTTEGQDAASFNVYVQNTGGGTLSWNDNDSETETWLKCDTDSGTAAAGEIDTAPCALDTDALAVGSHQAGVTYSDPLAAGSPITVTVHLTVNDVTQGLQIQMTNPERIPDLTAVKTLAVAGIPDTSSGWSTTNFNCDGTEDGAGLQAAINAAGANAIIQLNAATCDLNNPKVCEGTSDSCTTDADCNDWPGQWCSTPSLTVNKSNIILRGQGPASTTVELGEGTGELTGVIRVTGTWTGASASLTANVAVEDTSFKVATGADIAKFAVGEYWTISHDASSPPLKDTNSNYYKESGQSDGIPRQTVKVLSVNAGTGEVTIDSVFHEAFLTSKNAVATEMTPRTRVGFENMTLSMANSSIETLAYTACLRFYAVAESWVKNVRFYRCDQYAMIFGADSFRNIFQGNVMEDNKAVIDGRAGDSQNYGLSIQTGATENLAWHNRTTLQYQSFNIQTGAIGNVVAYNWLPSTNRCAARAGGAGIGVHGHWPGSNIIEGNDLACDLRQDRYWGPQGPRNTFFRNRVRLASALNSEDQTYPALEWILIGYQTNWLLNSAYYIFKTPWCGPPFSDCCASNINFNLHQDSAWVEKNTYRGCFNTVQDPSYPATYLDNVNSSSPPAAWSGLTFPASLWLDARPSWWCSETPWPATGPDLDTFDAGSPYDLTSGAKLPAQRLYDLDPCTTN
jgi:hypothetical protein